MSRTLSYYALQEADGAGMHNKTVGLVQSENTAQLWVNRNPGWRSYKRTTIVIFDNIDEFDREEKSKKIESMLRTFNTEEMLLLREHFTS